MVTGRNSSFNIAMYIINYYFFFMLTSQTFIMQRINEAMSKPGVSAKLKDVLTQVSGYENVPRKKAKFQVSGT